jgi:hypothetical protein
MEQIKMRKTVPKNIHIPVQQPKNTPNAKGSTITMFISTVSHSKK